MSVWEPFVLGDVVVHRGGGERRRVCSIDKVLQRIGTLPVVGTDGAVPTVEPWDRFQRVRA